MIFQTLPPIFGLMAATATMTLAIGPTASAAVSVTLSDVQISRDGTGLLKIVAVDEAMSFSQSISAFHLVVGIDGTVDGTRRLSFIDDKVVVESRLQPDYVFADQPLFLSEQEISDDGQSITVTDALNFTEPAVSLGRPQTLATVRIGVQSGQPLTTGDSFSLVVGDRTRLFDAIGNEISSGNVVFVDGPARLAVAVPEPGTFLLVSVLGGALGLSRRRGYGFQFSSKNPA